MSDQFDTVNLQGTTYQIPKADTNPPWGEQLNDYLKALGDAFSSLVGPADISETSATIANNQASATNVTGLSFDSSTVRSATIEYDIYRTTNTTVKKEAGLLQALFDSSASMGQKWSLTREGQNDSSVDLTITDAGQVQYTSDNMSGTGYTGKITFRARAILQA